ncbi:putative transposase [Cricetulus griseus]|uniref:Putative transposase n=1 Tax=Cricetulus griseus TaxID=10029 RepID=A0A061IJ64_CRIGR|nr:putative transposase [Cricetulus griseus]
MRRGQCKSIFNNRKPNMTPPEARKHTPATPEHHNADEAEENDLKNIFMKMIEDLKEGMGKSLKEMEEKSNQKIQDINKSLKETVQDLKTEVETIKKAQSDRMLEIEYLVKKEADIGQINDIGHAEQSQAGEPSKDTGKKKAETEGPQQTPEKQDMSFKRTNLLIVDLSVCATGVMFRKLSPVPIPSRVLPTSSFKRSSFKMDFHMLEHLY